MKYVIALTTLILCTAFVNTHAQKVDMSQFEHLKIRNIGPSGMSGRITAIDVDLSNPNRIYIGAASGGVWLSENGGTTWEPIFDDQPTQAIGAIAINQMNPSEIWVGTGEGNPRNSHNSGAGLFKSIDGGKTWNFIGLKDSKLIHRIIIHRDNPDIVHVGVMGSAWGPNAERGVFKTVDGGKTWKKVLYVDENTGIADLVVDPSNPNKLIAAMWQFRRTPWDFTSGGPGSGLYISYDCGTSWKELNQENGLPKGELGRIGMAIAPSKPNIVYALIEAKKNGFYKSVDGGENWELIASEDIGNRPFYYSEIYVDPKNENRIFNLWSYVSKSEDGGKTFETIADYGNNVHPDHHAFWIHPEDPNYLIDGNDGGLNISRDGGQNWTFCENIPVGQFYHVSVDNDYPYHIYGGMQDNGSWIGPSYVLKAGGIRNYDWQELYFGDGFDVLPKPNDSRYGYAMSQGGNLGFYDRITGRTQFIKPTHPEGVKLRFNWNAGLAEDPFNPCGVYYGSQFVHKSEDCGESWRIISPDLTTNDKSKQNQDTSGGLTIDATHAENHTTILCISPSPVNSEIIWVGTDDGNLQLTVDGGATWKNLANKLPGAPRNAWIPQILVPVREANEAFVVVNNYRMNDWTPFLYYTNDQGNSWTRLVDASDVDGFVTAIVQDPKEENLLFLGTDVGLYVSFDKGRHWNKWRKGFPSVQIRDLQIQEREEDLVIGTFGRAFWVLDDIRPLRKIAQTNSRILNEDFAIFQAPDAHINYYRSYDGIRFVSQGEYIGDNRPRGAMLTTWLKEKQNDTEKIEMDTEEEMEAPGAKLKNKLILSIYDESGNRVRKYSAPIEQGLYRTQWNLRGDGIQYPTRTASDDDFAPSGSYVLPGLYKIVASYNSFEDSTWINVESDPRLKTSVEELMATESVRQDFNQYINASREAFEQLKDAQSSISMAKKMLETLPDSTRMEVKKLGKTHSEKIDDLMKMFMNPEDTKGIQRDPDQLNRKLRVASNYLNSSWSSPGLNTQNALSIAKVRVREVVDAVNNYFNTEWPEYTEQINALQLKIFKEKSEIRIE